MANEPALFARMELRITEFEKKLAQANRTAERELAKFDRRARQSAEKFQSVFKRTDFAKEFGRGLLTGAAAGLSIDSAKRFIDAATRIQNSLKTAGLSGTQLTSVYDRLFASAQKNAAPLEALVGLYSKVSLAQNELGVSSDELASFTDGVALALRASGKSAQESSGALLQLGQALGGDIVRAEEFNSILEGAPTILTAVAAGMDRAGGSVAKLRQLVVDGAVSSREFFQSFQRGRHVLDAMVSGTRSTMDQGFTRLGNTLTDVAGRLDRVTGASDKVGENISRLAALIDLLATAFEGVAGSPVGKFLGLLDQIIEKVEPLNAGLDKLAQSREVGIRIREMMTATDDQQEFNVRRRLTRQFDAARASVKAGNLGPDQGVALAKFQQDLEKGLIPTAEEAKKAIDAIAEMKPGTEEQLHGFFDNVLDQLNLVILKAEAAKAALRGVGDPVADQRDEQRIVSGARRERAQVSQFLTERERAAAESELERQIKEKEEDILKAAGSLAGAIDKATLRVAAMRELGIEQATRAGEAAASTAADLVKRFEGFRETPYWDVNALRVGFGSDTVTLDDGSVRKVTAGMSVTIADANRDLARRIAEFQNGIRAEVGGDLFDSLTDQQKAALTSLAYNYGSLPDDVAGAVRGGDAASVYARIKARGADNGGVNRDRRNQEAELYLSDAPIGAQNLATSREGFKEQIDAYRQTLGFLREETGLRATLNPLVEDYGLGLTTLQAAQELLNAAQAEGTAAGRELSSAQQLLTGNLAGLTPEAREQALAMRELAEASGAAQAESNRLDETQGRLRDNMGEVAALGKDVFGGFIQDLRNGKSAAEALGNALGRLGDKLLSSGLDLLFDGPVSGSGKGALGGLFSFLLPGFAAGGRVRGPGGPRGDKIPAMLSDGEHVTNARSAQKYGPLLDAINNDTLARLADGGWPMRAPVIAPFPTPQRGRAGSTDTVNVMLRDDSGRMAEIADQRIVTRSGTIVNVAVQRASANVMPTIAAHRTERAGSDWRR